MQKSSTKILCIALFCCYQLSISALSFSFFNGMKKPLVQKGHFAFKKKKTQNDTLHTPANDSMKPISRKVSTYPLKQLKPFFLTMALISCPVVLGPNASYNTANAAAPVTPIKNFKPPDSKAIALKKITDERNKKKMQEEMAHRIKCDDIEREQGLKARKAYEKAFLQEKIQKAQIRSLERQKLLYSLVDQGICPFVDVEGERQMYLFDYDIDLNKVPSSAQQKEMMKLRRDKKWLLRREKERFIIKCIVDDLKVRGEDPLKYLEANKAKTRDIFNLKDKQLDMLFNRYTYLMESQGNLSGIKADTPFDMEAAASSVNH
jgi:hypothetical protein